MRRLRLLVGGVVAALVASLAVPAGAATAPWTVDPVPAPRYDVGFLNDVSCPTVSFCMAVGSGYRPVQSEGRPGLAARWDGTAWTAVALPRVGGRLDLVAVSCPDTTDCLALGTVAPVVPLDHSVRTMVLALRWDGSAWSSVAAPPGSPGQFDGYFGLDCVAPDDCTAVGSVARGNDDLTTAPVVMQWDGARWSDRTGVLASKATSMSLSSVACATSHLCFAVGLADQKQVLVAGTDQRWQVVPLPAAADGTTLGQLSSVACGGPTSCLAVGAHYSRASQDDTAAAFRWDGGAWSITPTPAPGATARSALGAVACASPTSCEAVGSNLGGARTFAPYAQRWDGTTWSLETLATPASGDADRPAAVDCAAAGSCMTVGYHPPPDPVGFETMAQIRDAGSWRIVPTPNVSMAYDGRLNQISCATDDACVAVGFYGAPYVPSPPAVVRWNGIRWADIPASSAVVPALVSCGSPGRCMVAGPTPARHRNQLTALLEGTTWTPQQFVVPPGRAPGDIIVTGLSCPSARTCFAVTSGSLGSLFERWTTAQGWTLLPPPPVAANRQLRLADVSCVDDDWCLAVGTEQDIRTGDVLGSAAVWDGIRWTTTALPFVTAYQTMTKVSCASPVVCAALGGDLGRPADIVRWDGSSWHAEPPVRVSGKTLTGISCGSETSCTAVGALPVPRQPPYDVAFAQSWDGTTWTADTTQPPGGQPLRGVSCHAVCRAVGALPGAVSRAEG